MSQKTDKVALAGLDQNTVLRTLQWARNFTSGHGYSFLKVAEYLVTQCQDKCKADFFFQMHSQFIESEAYKDILSRSFDLDFDEEASIQIILRSVSRNDAQVTNAESLLEKIGVWNRDKAWFFSDLFHTFVLNNVLRLNVSQKSELKLGQADSMVEVLLHALGNLQTNDLLLFNHSNETSWRIENGIGNMLCFRLLQIPGLFVSPQTPVIVDKSADSKRGMHPTIDFYLNGRLNMYLELTRNGWNVKQHFDKFEMEDGPYRKQKKNYVILDFELKSHKPTLVPKEYVQCGDNFYCYVLMRNSLYKNGKLVKENVSHNIPSPKGAESE
jgi:hypothetical protein